MKLLTRAAILCSAALLPVVLTAGSAEAATTDAGPIQTEGLCMDGSIAGVLAVGNQAHVNTCDSSAPQTWTFDNTAGLIQIASNTTLCLDVQNNDENPGSHVQVFGCNGTPAQVWAFNTATGQFTSSGGLCLTAAGEPTTAGAELTVETCTGGGDQQWTIPAVTSAGPMLAPMQASAFGLVAAGGVMAIVRRRSHAS